jgi:excisionase family DNA binding protein
MARSRPAIEPDAIYSRQDAARLLGVSLSTLKKLIDQGHLRVSRPPGMRRIFIKGASILAMLEATIVEKA